MILGYLLIDHFNKVLILFYRKYKKLYKKLSDTNKWLLINEKIILVMT